MSIINGSSGNGAMEMVWPNRDPRGATQCHCCHPASCTCLSSTFHSHSHVLIQLNPAPSSAQDQLSLLSLPNLPPARPALHHCSSNGEEGVVTPPHGKSRNRHQVTDKMHKHNSLLWKQLMALLKHFSQLETFKFSQSVTTLHLSLSFLPLSCYLTLQARASRRNNWNKHKLIK